jgi:hypothetical protein
VYAVYAEIAAGHNLDDRMRQLQTENAQLQRDVNARQSEIAQAGSPAWLEEQARRLGYVRPGERVFVLASPGVPLPPDGGVDVSQLPTFAPSPSPGAPSPTPVPITAPAASASPTPYILVVPSPTPSPH